MNYIGRVAQGVKDFYYELNSSTLTGAIDVIVIQQEDGSFRCSPFHVRFGKLALIKTKDLTVDILINGQPIDLHMYLGEAGEAYFLEDKELDETAGENSQSNQSSASYDSNSKLNEIPPITVTDVDDVVKSGVVDSASLQPAKNSQDSEKRESLNANVDHKAAFFYSDGEITPEQTSPAVSRPPSPKSDTEAEIKHPEKSSQWSWNWGQLPERKKPEQTKSSNRNEENLATKKSSSSRLFGSMFNLIGSSESKSGSGSGSGASGPTIPSKQDEIYLDDTEKLDSEVAALYLNQKSVSPQMQRPNLSAVSTTNNQNQQSVTMNSIKEKKLKKTTRLSSSQIEELNLNPGANEIVYSVTTALQGTTRITSYIFLWNYDEKVIVSDIDGTITKSDVWGQVLPIFGKDWTQAGVADLYSAIENNHYKFMYLSARAIGQSRITRDLLKNVNQGGLTLPKGPLLVTPSSLFTAFQKEVIEKKPEEFKISCLQDIRSLFPSCHNPFYAGYGNKTSDVVAYKTVGIPVSRIFTINPQGELKHEVSRTFQSSYSNLCDFADLIFPPLKPSAAIIQPEYDSFNFWRVNEISDDLMAEIEEEAKKANLAASASRKAKDQSKSASKTSTITKQKSK